MGLIKAAVGAVGGVLADQWREYFYCDALKEDTLCVKGQKRVSARSSNYHGNDNIISSGSIVSVADGQCMLVVEQGKVVEVCATPGEYIFDSSTEPSIFDDEICKSIKPVFASMGKRFSFGGETPKDQRVYYFNTKEIHGNRFGTATPIPFRVVDRNIGLDMDVSITCFGTFSYRITNPLLFYANVCGNFDTSFKRDCIDDQLESELMTKLQPAFAAISKLGIRYSELPSHTDEMAGALNDALSSKWRELRGIEVVSFALKGINVKDEDERMIKELQRNATFRDPTMAAAHLIGAQSAAMQAAASNEKAGPAMAFMGMNMASIAGGFKPENLFKMNIGISSHKAPGTQVWSCSCGNLSVQGNFCPVCGQKKPTPTVNNTWTCQCGSINSSAFCAECGARKPLSDQQKCVNCGWVNEQSAISNFCPNCGTPLK